jgi:hypothetical protein
MGRFALQAIPVNACNGHLLDGTILGKFGRSAGVREWGKNEEVCVATSKKYLIFEDNVCENRYILAAGTRREIVAGLQSGRKRNSRAEIA